MSDRAVAFLAGLACAAAIVGGVEQARIQWRDAAWHREHRRLAREAAALDGVELNDE